MGKDKKLNNWRLCVTHGDHIAYVQAHGAELVRWNGSHMIFKGPNGRMFPIQGNHLSWRMVPGMKAKLKRELLDAGIPILEE